MPARRKKRNKKKKIHTKKILQTIFVIVILIGAYFLSKIILSEKEWDGENKLNIVINGNEYIAVAALDPQNNELVIVKIPSDTEVEVARNLGRWRLGSVWELGENEGLGGKLLAETVTRYFDLPVYSYIDKEGLGILQSNIFSSVQAVIYPTKSNMTDSDLFNIARFIASVKNPDKTNTDLSETNILVPEELKGGGMGYKKVRDLPQWIIAPFSNEDVANELTTVKIINNSENRVVSTKLGKVIEATGAKVAQVVNNNEMNGNCFIESENEGFGIYYAKLFDCEYKGNANDSFDIVVTINQDFVERY